MAVLTVPKILREKLTEEGAEALVVLLDIVESHAHDTTLETVEEKFERRLTEVRTGLEMKIAELKVAIGEKIDAKIDSIDTKIDSLRTTIDGKIESLRDTNTRFFTWIIGLIVVSWLSTILLK